MKNVIKSLFVAFLAMSVTVAFAQDGAAKKDAKKDKTEKKDTKMAKKPAKKKAKKEGDTK